MSELIELYFEIAYKVIGRIIYGKKLSEQQTTIPLYVKVIAACVPIIVFVFLIWIIIEINN